jgi:N6-L-threonylcarbamoyladenine synthase
MLILGIESSCDETSVSVSLDGRCILSNVVSTQIAEHRKFGGVVPEIASRRHCENILSVTKQALEDAGKTLEDIDAIAVTYAPGLIGALLVGVNFAKGLAMALDKPLVPVHHLAGHVAANYITHKDLEPPYLCLIASGGHSHIVEVLDYCDFRIVGRTRDDAAGECFDKCARAMGLPYPGGIEIQKAAESGNGDNIKLPRPKVAGNEYDFSFSGLKTAVINKIHNARQKGEDFSVNDIASALQNTIAEILSDHTLLAAKNLGYKKIAVAGGVSANSALRAAFEKKCSDNNIKLYLPELKYCGDNGAMIATAGYYAYLAGIRADIDLNAKATLSIDKWGK